MRYGIVWPHKITFFNYFQDLPIYIGLIVGDSKVWPSPFEHGHFMVQVKEPQNTDDQLFDGTITIHEDCLIEIKDCFCDTSDMFHRGCICGGFKSEMEFKRRTIKP